MYKAPDFVKVSAKAQDIFASYTTHCHYDETTLLDHLESSGNCKEPTVYATYIDLHPSNIHQCYSTSNP